MPSYQPPATAISRRVLLVADNQLHNLYGEPVPLLRSAEADKLVQTAIRPVQLDFYGQDFLAWLVEHQGNVLPVVHVGDACDLSCTGEFHRFWTIVRQARQGWVMAPGNHDGFFYGNEHRDVQDRDWSAACKNAGVPMPKDLFVRLYLAAVTLQPGRDAQALARFMGLPSETLEAVDLDRRASLVPSQGDWRYGATPGDERPLLRAVSWRLDAAQPWRSFVVQEVDVTLDRAAPATSVPVSLVLLDTTQYAVRPALVPLLAHNAGLTGELLTDQRAIVQSWIEAQSRPKHVWVLAGHHPFDSLSSAGQQAVEALRQRARAPLYVSAHTHSGQFIVHGRDDQQATWLELNLGSIIDWSLDFRTLQFFLTDTGQHLLLRSPRFTMPEFLAQARVGVPVNDEQWEAKPDEEDYYLRHEDLKTLSAHDTEIRLKDTLLATYRRLLRHNPTRTDAPPDAPFWPPCCQNDTAIDEAIRRVMNDPQLHTKIGLLVALERFEQQRPVQDPDTRRKFRLSQAIWASKYDAVHSRKPLVDNLFIVFPEE